MTILLKNGFLQRRSSTEILRIARIIHAAIPEEDPTSLYQEIRDVTQAILFPRVALDDCKLLSHYSKLLSKERPFENCVLIIVQHFLRDLVPFVEALKRLGAKPENTLLLCKPYPYPYKGGLKTYLEVQGFKIFLASVMEEVADKVKELVGAAALLLTGEKKLLVIEDGGYVVPFLHKELSCRGIIEQCLGAVEQTSKGMQADEKISDFRMKAVMDVARSVFKEKYEAPLIGETVTRNIRTLLPDVHLYGKRALVVGYGPIGKNVATHLHDHLGMVVSVAEIMDDRFKEAEAHAGNRGFIKHVVKKAKDIIKECDLIVATTPVTSIGEDEISLLKNDSILLSSSSDQIAIEISKLEYFAGDKERIRHVSAGTRYELTFPGDRKVSIFLLADGYPVNFYGSESVPNQSIDPILTELLLSAVELTSGAVGSMGTNTKKYVDDMNERRGLIAKFKELYSTELGNLGL